MRNLKKLLGNDLLQLAIMLSLLRVDPSSLLYGASNGGIGQEGDNTQGDVWTQTLFGDMAGSNSFSDLSPRLHFKSMDSMLERLQTEILEDLNNLGRVTNRFRTNSEDDLPIEISAYVLNTAGVVAPQMSSSFIGGSRQSRRGGSGSGDSDSGISDTDVAFSNFGSDISDSGESDREDASQLLVLNEDSRDSHDVEMAFVDPLEVEGVQQRPHPALDHDYIPNPEDVENELVRIDEQLVSIEENLDVINVEVFELDEQIASQVEVNDEQFEDLSSPELLGRVAFEATPFDDWEADTNRGLEELLHLSNDLFSDGEKEKSDDDDKFSFDNYPYGNGDTAPPNAVVNTNSNVINSNGNNRIGFNSNPIINNNNNEAVTEWHAQARKFEPESLDDLLRSPASYPEGLLRNNPTLQQANTAVNQSFPEAAGAPMGFGPNQNNHLGLLPNSSSSATTQTSTADDHQAALDSLLNIPTSSESDLMKTMLNFLTGDLHDDESAASVWGRPGAPTASSSSSSSHQPNLQPPTAAVPMQSTTNGALLADESIDFSSSAESGAAAASSSSSSLFYPSSLGPTGFAGSYGHTPSSYVPYTPQLHHTYAAVAAVAATSLQHQQQHQRQAQQFDDVETASHTSGKSNRSSRSKDFSFDSGSIKQDPDGLTERQRQSRDEKKARDLGIPFSIHDIINLPMDEFNDMLSRHELNEEQLTLCRDIRRRGKNKVAAQNCRKRKIEQIAQLEEQVKEARHRKNQLMMERNELYRIRREWRSALLEIEKDVLSGLNKNIRDFTLDLNSDPSDVRIVSRPPDATVGTEEADSRLNPSFYSFTSGPFIERRGWDDAAMKNGTHH